MATTTIDRAPIRRRPHCAVQERRFGSGTLALETGMELLGLWIRDARLRAGISQAGLARASGLHQSTISRLERGRLEGLRLHRLARLLLVLDGALDGQLFHPTRRRPDTFA